MHTIFIAINIYIFLGSLFMLWWFLCFSFLILVPINIGIAIILVVLTINYT